MPQFNGEHIDSRTAHRTYSSSSTSSSSSSDSSSSSSSDSSTLISGPDEGHRDDDIHSPETIHKDLQCPFCDERSRGETLLRIHKLWKHPLQEDSETQPKRSVLVTRRSVEVQCNLWCLQPLQMAPSQSSDGSEAADSQRRLHEMLSAIGVQTTSNSGRDDVDFALLYMGLDPASSTESHVSSCSSAPSVSSGTE